MKLYFQMIKGKSVTLFNEIFPKELWKSFRRWFW